ncbi:MAG: GGDEF domain-containing protein, partial [Deltaproteobacteria bacterium]|nr:GGDEF domain-containing protein [Deltaproteobacteria bacterium]
TEVTSIDRALSVLGTNVIKNIALSFVIATDLRGENHTGFDFDNYWRQSVTSAVAAELLSKHLGQNNDDIFVTALLHNIGMLIFFLNKKEEYSQLLQITDLATKSLIEAERRAFKYDHQQAGALLIKKWGLPDQIAEPINYHHSPESAPEEYQSTAYILQFADRISAIYTETDSAEKVRILQSDLENQYSFDQDSIRILLDQVAEQSFGILKTFEIEPGDMKPYSQMLQEANEELGRLNLSYEQLVIELKEAKDKSDRLANELSDANLRLNDLVYIDALTGAYNHRYFQENLSTELARAERYNFSVSLILFDIDDFKKVNDTCGHPAGDKVLTNIVRAIKKTVRPSDVVARYGGEEFAVILPETDISGLKVFAARLRRCVEGLTTTTEGKQIKVTISVGGTTYQSDQPVGKEALIKTADIGLYRSKENGRNQVTLLAPNGNSPI